MRRGEVASPDVTETAGGAAYSSPPHHLADQLVLDDTVERIETETGIRFEDPPSGGVPLEPVQLGTGQGDDDLGVDFVTPAVELRELPGDQHPSAGHLPGPGFPDARFAGSVAASITGLIPSLAGLGKPVITQISVALTP